MKTIQDLVDELGWGYRYSRGLDEGLCGETSSQPKELAHQLRTTFEEQLEALEYENRSLRQLVERIDDRLIDIERKVL